MVRWISTLAMLIASALAAVAHPPPVLTVEQERRYADEVIAFRKALVDAIASKDVVKLREMYADSFNHTHTSGKSDDKDARIAALLAGKPAIENAEVEDLRIRVPGGWTAIATGTSPITSPADGKTHDVTWTAVYVRAQKGDWQVAASHATRAGERKP